MSNQEETLAAFQAITGASAEESRHFLSAYNWDLNEATSAFLDSEDGEVNTQGAFTNAAQTPARQQQAQPPAQPTAQQKPPTSKPKQPARGGIATLGSLSRDDGSDDDSSDDEQQKYYAGGEKSGQMIQYPKAQKRDTDEVVGEVFDSAKKHGAQVAEPPKAQPPSYFGGQGFTLGATNQASVPIQPRAQPQRQGPPEVNHTITFWRNGFTVDNGPLRSFEDPANKEFLDSINKGVVPEEMARGAVQGTKFGTNLVDNRQQEYKEPPKPKYVSFSGSGNTLGSTSSAPATQTPATAEPKTPTGNFSVDETKPVTSIQIRLADGTRLVSKFNLTHTVGDIRRFVEAARRGGPAFDLMTTFPQKVLSDSTQTITDAGLQNAVIVQKPK